VAPIRNHLLGCIKVGSKRKISLRILKIFFWIENILLLTFRHLYKWFENLSDFSGTFLEITFWGCYKLAVKKRHYGFYHFFYRSKIYCCILLDTFKSGFKLE